MHVLITGGAGFIGSHLAEFHLKQGHQVYVVDDLSTGSMDNIAPFIQNPQFRYDISDILTWSGLNEAVLWADRIYHMAAVIGVFKVLKNPVSVLTTNMMGCQRLLDAVAMHPLCTPVLIASSSCVYGINPKVPSSESDTLELKSAAQGLWGYAISKLADEALGLAYAREKNVRVVIARLFNIIGPRQSGHYGMVVPRFIQQALTGEPITVFGDGHQTRSFFDVRDTVEIFDALLHNEATMSQIVNVGGSSEMSINTLAQLIKKITKSKSEIQHESYQKAYGESIDETIRRRPDLTKLHSLISFKPKWTIEETLCDLAGDENLCS